MAKKYDYDTPAFAKAVADAKSIAGVAKLIGLRPTGGNFGTFFATRF